MQGTCAPTSAAEALPDCELRRGLAAVAALRPDVLLQNLRRSRIGGWVGQS
jgi:hypothetical protein